ncbi:MAG: LPXTG cell wall anchor domain-containing protein [Muribaculaceae bacterium]|nr:LPXTG cell wall anchor domain-containing protein [Muribaculaceae bacterium]
MLKKFLIGTFAALAFSAVNPVNTMASEADKVNIDESGFITLTSDHAADDRINTLQLVFKVETEDGCDISFEFDPENNIKVSEYRYDAKSNQLYIYMSDSQPLFDDSNLLNIGAVSAKDTAGNNVSVTINEAEEALKYIYNNTVTSVDADFNIEITTTSKPTTSTTTTTETTSKPTTSATTSKPTTTETTSKSTTTATTSKSTTTATTSKPTTTETTSKPTTTETTSKSTTTATISKPTTTTTTSEPTITTTSEPTTTTTSEPTTTTTTTTTTPTTTTTTAKSTTTTMTTTSKHIASDEEFCSWSINNYNDKNGIMPDSAEITEQADGKYQITLTDNSDNVLDVYVINPETGIGTDSAGNEVDLPQTGNNSLKNVLIAVGAFMMTAFGFCAVKLSGITRRKKNEQ